MTESYIGTLERGEIHWPNADYRRAFRTFFNATDAELGFYIDRPDDAVTPEKPERPARAGQQARIENERPPVDAERFTDKADELQHAAREGASLRPSVSALAAALNTMPVAPFDLVDLRALSLRITNTRSAYQHSRYRQAVAELSPILSQIRGQSLFGDDGQAVSGLATEAYQVASGLLLKFDEQVPAAVAADRSLAAAFVTEDPVSIASAARAVTHTMIAAGHPGQAVTFAVAAAERLRHDAKAVDAQTLSVHGALLLRAASAAAAVDDRHHALDLLSEADRLAADLGRDANLRWTAFGPTNVTLHRVAIATQLGDAGTAVHLGTAVDTRQLAVAERRAMLHLDLARAYIQWGRYELALQSVAAADHAASEEVRSRPATANLILELAQRCPPRFRHRVTSYAQEIGISVE